MQKLLKAFLEVLSDLLSSKLFQISMDGSNANHKFYRLFCADRSGNIRYEWLSFIKIGPCELYVSHGEF